MSGDPADHRARAPDRHRADGEERERLVRDVGVRHGREDPPRGGAGHREPHPLVGDVVDRDAALGEPRAEPSEVPVLEVVGTDDPEPIVLEARDRQVAHEAPGVVQHRREPDPPDLGEPRGDELVEPRLRPRDPRPRTGRTARSRRRRRRCGRPRPPPPRSARRSSAPASRSPRTPARPRSTAGPRAPSSR